MNQRPSVARVAASLLLSLPAIFPVPTTNAMDEPPPPLEKTATIPLPGVEGRIDHMSLDAASGRLFVAALGSGTVEVVDLKERRVVGEVKDLKEPQGVLVLPDRGEFAVSCGGDGTVRFFEAATLKPLRSGSAGEDADNLRWDAATKRVVAGVGNGALAWLDPATGKTDGEARLDGHPESFALEAGGARAFVNVPSAGHVAVVDRAKRTVTARWTLGECRANFPMALDEEHRRLFVGCRRPARLLVMNSDDGKILDALECPQDPDDVFLDPASGRVLVSGGDGCVDVFARDAEGSYVRAARVTTAPGARTALFSPERGELHVAAPARSGNPAAILVYRLLGK